MVGSKKWQSFSPRAVVEKFPYNEEALKEFVEQIKGTELEELMLRYPTVYVIYYRDGSTYQVYVGETNDIQQRTQTHLFRDPDGERKKEEQASTKGLVHPKDLTGPEYTWTYFKANDATIFVIGHTFFNKSMTLDIEDRLISFILSAGEAESDDAVKVRLHNKRHNIQSSYFTSEYVERAFSQIWRKLRKHEKKLFPLEDLVRDSALFKASPFHRLNEQQVDAKVKILDTVHRALRDSDSEIGQDETHLIVVQGAAGTGKTVLLSSVFYDLVQGILDERDKFDFQPFDAYMIVNHDEQLTVYQEVAERLGISNNKNERVMKPTRFINKTSPDEKVDVVLIDEAHLLWTQGKQSYRGDNQLKDIIERAHVVVAIFDEDQILAGNQYWSQKDLDALYGLTPADDEASLECTTEVIALTQQMRIDSDGPAEDWIRKFVDDREIGPIPNERYTIDVFESPVELHAKIVSLQGEEESNKRGLSRLIATYDWEFSSARKTGEGKNWEVTIGDFSLPWNNQIKSEKRRLNKLSWAERPQTVDEVGSIFTIQGFDLNYAGVIIGPSVKYRDGKVVFDASESKNPNVTHKRTILKDGKPQKIDVGERLVKNQLNVLLTRGVHGLGIYAVDPALRKALRAAKQKALK